MSAQVPAPSAGPPIGLIVGGVVLIIVVIVIVLWQTGVFKSEPDAVSSGPGPSPGPMAPGPAQGPTQYTTGSQNITALISGLNATWGSRVSTCPNIVQQAATWFDSQGIIAVPRGASCPSSAQTLGPSIGANSTITLCVPRNAPPNIQLPDSIQTPLYQCAQLVASPAQNLIQ